MFDFLRKDFLWRAFDSGILEELDKKISYQPKIAQDLSIYELLREERNLKIAEIGGGSSRMLRQLALRNQCYNIEKFEGRNAGPDREVEIDGVSNLHAYIGEFDEAVEDAFSVSVVEHIKDDQLTNFQNDLLRILKPGGVFYHAIDMYLQDEPSEYVTQRFERYRGLVFGDNRIEPLGELKALSPHFECTMVSNPDNVLHDWNCYAPQLSELRQASQSVSLLIGGRKR